MSRLGTTPIRVREDQIEDRPALPTPVPGLAIVDTGDENYPYSVTHVRSGLAVAWADHPEACIPFVADIAHIDWTLSGADLAPYGDEVRDAIARHGLTRDFSWRPADPFDLPTFGGVS